MGQQVEQFRRMGRRLTARAALQVASQVIAFGSHPTKLLRLLPIRLSGKHPVTDRFASMKRLDPIL